MQHDTKSSEHICMGEICLQFKQLFVYISQLANFGISLCISPILASLDRVWADNEKNPTFIFKKCKQNFFVYIYILLFVYNN